MVPRRSLPWLRALALLLLGSAPPAVAWVRTGHEAISRITEGLLPEKRRAQVRHLLQHMDIFEAGGWELAATGKFPQTKPMHWHRQSPEWTCSGGLGDGHKHVQCDGHGAEQGSLLCALGYFFDHFAHDELLREYPAPKEPLLVPQELPPLKGLPSEVLDSAHYLRWLVILLGDLHQPLHWLQGSFDYGRRIKVVWRGERYTLLDFFEEFLPKRLALPGASTLRKKFDEKAMNWGYLTPPELFRQWARESAETACKIYSAMEVNHADGARNITSPFALSEELYREWASLWTLSATNAGMRLAFVLEDLLEHRRHKEAHKEGRGRTHARVRWYNNFLTNAGLAALVVPTVLLFLRWHLGLSARGGKGLVASFLGKDSIDKC